MDLFCCICHLLLGKQLERRVKNETNREKLSDEIPYDVGWSLFVGMRTGLFTNSFFLYNIVTCHTHYLVYSFKIHFGLICINVFPMSSVLHFLCFLPTFFCFLYPSSLWKTTNQNKKNKIRRLRRLHGMCLI